MSDDLDFCPLVEFLCSRFPAIVLLPAVMIIRDREQRLVLTRRRVRDKSHVFAPQVHVREHAHARRIARERAVSSDRMGRGTRRDGKSRGC